LDDEPIPVSVKGQRSDGNHYEAMAFVPHAFPYVLMKLCAFDDRKNDQRRDVGRHHVLDLYTIVGLMTEAEYDRARELGRKLALDGSVRRAGAIVRDHFATLNSIGLLRLREHALYTSDFAIDDFIAVLNEILPV
jgi:hypothetical protein